MPLCCERASWQREEIADHKFDYIDVDDFVSDSWLMKIKYSFVFIMTLKSILVYMADIGIVILLFVTNTFAILIQGQSETFRKACQENNVPGVCGNLQDAEGSFSTLIPLQWRPWIILGSIILSFILLFVDWKKAQVIIRSRDIAYAFTSTIAFRYYVIRSYPHYCFFQQINNSKRTVDILAFWVFFGFKGWKRLLLAEFPRQFLNALNLIDLYRASLQNVDTNLDMVTRSIRAVQNIMAQSNNAQLIAHSLSLFTVTIWLMSFCSLLVAFIVYIPLLCQIRGNLKEYCCHKIDKRIAELLKKKSRRRMEEARRAELAEIERAQADKMRGMYSDDASEYGGSTSGKQARPPLGMKQAPTLPNVDVDLDAAPTRPQQFGFAPSTMGYQAVPVRLPVGYAYSEYAPSTVDAASDGYPTMSTARFPPPGPYGVPPPPMPPMPPVEMLAPRGHHPVGAPPPNFPGPHSNSEYPPRPPSTNSDDTINRGRPSPSIAESQAELLSHPGNSNPRTTPPPPLPQHTISPAHPRTASPSPYMQPHHHGHGYGAAPPPPLQIGRAVSPMPYGGAPHPQHHARPRSPSAMSDHSTWSDAASERSERYHHHQPHYGGAGGPAYGRPPQPREYGQYR
ncbi:hypothetical protein HK102_012871 [Quaeritorhiza haematococci]|nr:hypothetical protein HK102_012871 [Quaeritorhiza haematococci]